jgi:hypothetical protein
MLSTSTDTTTAPGAHLVHVEDLTSGLLHFTHLVHEVPEAGLGHNLIGSKQLHAVGGRIGVRLRGGLSANNLVEIHLQSNKGGPRRLARAMVTIWIIFRHGAIVVAQDTAPITSHA